MPYPLDLSKEDTTSLLELVNYTNPETIGSPLTFDKIDIQDFVKNIPTASVNPEHLVVKRLPSNELHLFGTVGEVATNYGLEPSAVSAAAIAVRESIISPMDQALLDSWEKDSVSFDASVPKPDLLPWAVVAAKKIAIANAAYDTRPVAFCAIHNKIMTAADLTAKTVTVGHTQTSTAVSVTSTFGVGIRPLGTKDTLSATLRRYSGSTDWYCVIQYNEQELHSNKIPSIEAGRLSNRNSTVYVDFKLTKTNVTVVVNGVNVLIGQLPTAAIEAVAAATEFQQMLLLSNTNTVSMYMHAFDFSINKYGFASVLNAGTVAIPDNIQIGYRKNLTDLALALDTAISHGTAFDYSGFSGAKLVNRSYLKDTADVKYSRIALTDLVSLPVTSTLWDWYNSSEWVQERDIPLALQMFKDLLMADGIDADKALRNLNVTRTKGEDNYWYLNFTFDSYVLKDLEFSIFRMPGNFSDTVTVTDLNGFVYAPIASSSVIN